MTLYYFKFTDISDFAEVIQNQIMPIFNMYKNFLVVFMYVLFANFSYYDWWPVKTGQDLHWIESNLLLCR